MPKKGTFLRKRKLDIKQGEFKDKFDTERLRPKQGEEVEPGDGQGERPELPLPGLPQPRVHAAAVHVHHDQDGRNVAEHVRQVVNLQIPEPILLINVFKI